MGARPEDGGQLGTVRTGSPAAVVLAGRRVNLGEVGLIGSAPTNTVVIDDERVSAEHARIYRDPDGWWIEDLGSPAGTTLNGWRLSGERHPLRGGDRLEVGGVPLEFVDDETRRATHAAPGALPVLRSERVRLEGPKLSIGRDPRNDLVLGDPNVSRFHAELERRDGVVTIEDLGSRNGTRVNGWLVERVQVSPGDQIGIGAYSLEVDADGVVARDEHGLLRLDAAGVEMHAADRRILAPTSLALEPAEFVVIIGESGAGKSTLLKVLAGVTRPTGGGVTVNREPLAARASDIGYVPQDEIVHPFLTVREALTYAARLRLADDVSSAEIAAAVDRVLAELALTEQAGTRIGSLSGGQRKRVGVGVELVSRPSVLFLDEPTSGLDPGLETRMMRLMRELADNGRTVAVVTHATSNLRLCDKLVVMGRGGELTFAGPPQEALAFFGVDDYDAIYTALAETPAADWRSRFEARSAPPAVEPVAPPAAPAAQGRRRALVPQLGILTQRYLKLLVRDRRNLAILLGQVPLLALAMVGLFKAGLFERPGGRPDDGVVFLFLLIVDVIWLGSLDGARELVRERSVFVRESAIGVRLSAYLLSKLVVLFGLITAQTLVLAGVSFAFRPLEEDAGTYAAVVGLLVLAGLVAVGMGLLISAAVGTDDQAISITPLAIIPQLLFAGAQVPVDRMAEPVASLSALIFGRWALAGSGTTVDMNGRFDDAAELGTQNRFGTDFFTVSSGEAVAILAAFLLVFLVGVVLLLRRQTRY